MKLFKRKVKDELDVNPIYEKDPNILNKICIAVIILLLSFNFMFSIVFISGESMSPTYHDGEFKMGIKHFNIDRFDVVVISTPNHALIKRVIGLPNETLEYSNNKLFINNIEIVDEYGFGFTDDFIITLKENEYFVLGDNRANSIDSRYYGSFIDDTIIAKILITNKGD